MSTNSNKSELAYRTLDEDNRRLFMKKMVALFGATTATAVLSGCSAPVAKQFAMQRPNLPKNGKLFSEHELTVLYSLCETILPKTDTPSAVEAGCHEFVPHQLQHCHSKQQQDDCIHIINAVELVANREFGQSFVLLQAPHQQQLLVDFETNSMSTESEKGQFRFLKALIVFGYFTSEIGVTKALNYQPVPGGFVGSIPANSETKSWSPQAYY
ncbi:gluconate 2-dehydrogenase subunit 3 family protein [uncultured Paraglaciecola sp.]|uniref:gluconate 2-dehydrogenase subunit 3 family protein n=1 Tax=uncultured Paraglaciecola sp. TaxID=1765024 RepID=UPI0030DAF90B|tara:strand:+ start:181569 stop:182207 length:639 start_codon:yes stop_codon:yes gene_type:complete